MCVFCNDSSMGSAGVGKAQIGTRRNIHNDNFDDYFKFLVVRHPLERLASAYIGKVVRLPQGPIVRKIKVDFIFFVNFIFTSRLKKVLCSVSAGLDLLLAPAAVLLNFVLNVNFIIIHYTVVCSWMYRCFTKNTPHTYMWCWYVCLQVQLSDNINTFFMYHKTKNSSLIFLIRHYLKT